VIHRRCGCREDGRQLGTKCPKLASDPKHGTWGYEFRLQGKKHRKNGFATKREAQQAATKLRASLDAGTYVEPVKKTLAEYAPEALRRREVTGNGLKPTTLANYERYVRQDIAPSQLGRMLLTDIRRSHVNVWIADLSKTRGAVTVRRALATLQMIMSMAVRDEILPASPASNVDKPAVADREVEIWEPDTMTAFIERCDRHRLGPLFEVVLHTGLRRGEISGLHWSDVDLSARQIVVRHNRVTVDGRVQETTTKTRSGRRTVPLSDSAVAALMGLEAQPGKRARGRSGGLGQRWPRVHDGRWTASRSGVRHQVVPEDQEAR
jgi:integrase